MSARSAPGNSRWRLDPPHAAARHLLWGCLFLTGTAFTGAVRADGLFVWRNEKIDIHEPEQKALIYFHDGIEDLVLSVRFEGAPEDFGWIVPLPAVPELFPENAFIFRCLSEATQERQYRRSVAGARLLATAGAKGVQVLQADTVGIYRAETLKAGGGEALQAWLEKEGYRLPPDAGGVLSRYVRDGWVFVTLRISSEEADSLTGERLGDGTIQPVRFRFTTREPIFPLEISSLGRDSSEVLLYVLAPELLVPRVPVVPAGDFWNSRVFSTLGEHHWIYIYEQDTGLERFLPDYLEPYRLSKHRARFAPAQMVDITFAPFDPAPRLRHADTGVRQEAVTHLGLVRPPGADSLLVSFLGSASSGAETFCALWALGEVGGEYSEAALLRRADDTDPETRLEALAALGRMGSRRAGPFLVRGLTATQAEPHSEASFADAAAQTAVQRISFEYLVRMGDARCAASLQSLVDSHDGRAAWLNSTRDAARGLSDCWVSGHMGYDPGVLALAALATLGPGEAFRTLVEAIVFGGHVTSDGELQAAAGRRVTINDFPSGFWTAVALVHEGTGLSQWPALGCADELFRFAPEMRDPLFRACAADPRLPPAGAVVLLGRLKAPEDADFARLREIWMEALRPPVRTIEAYDLRHARQRTVRPDARRAGPDPVPSAVRFNHIACSVVYALARHGRTDDLEFLYASAPADDAVLRGEIVFAMARQRDPRFREQVFRHVREVWNPAAAGEESRVWLQDREERRAARGEKTLWLHQPPFDLAHRVGPILAYVLDATLHGASNTTLLSDRSLHPYLRVVLLSHVPPGRGWTPSALSVLQAELEHLVQVDGSRDPLLRDVAARELEAYQHRVAWAAGHPR